MTPEEELALRTSIKNEIKAERDRAWAGATANPDFQTFKEYHQVGWLAMTNAAYIAGGRLPEDKVDGVPNE